MNPTVIYEMGYYIFEQEVIFFIKSWKSAKSKLLKMVASNQRGKKTLENIVDP